MQLTKNHNGKMKNLYHLLTSKEIKPALQTFHTNYSPASQDLTDEVQPKGTMLALDNQI